MNLFRAPPKLTSILSNLHAGSTVRARVRRTPIPHSFCASLPPFPAQPAWEGSPDVRNVALPLSSFVRRRTETTVAARGASSGLRIAD